MIQYYIVFFDSIIADCSSILLVEFNQVYIFLKIVYNIFQGIYRIITLYY